jgi:hypothetical protein
MARTPKPHLSLVAYCFLCTRSLVDPTTRVTVRVAPGANREGVCTECRAEVLVHLAPGAPVGDPIVPSPRLAPAELATEADEQHTKARPGWLVHDKGGKAVGWAATRHLAEGLVGMLPDGEVREGA